MGLLAVVLVLLGLFSWGYYARIRKEIPEVERPGALIQETASVTADFLEAGKAAELLSEGTYLGTISVRLQSRAHNRAGFCVTMYDTGNLNESYEAYKKSHPRQNREDFRALEQFLETYGRCYDEERNGLVYTTKNSAHLTDVLEWETELCNRIGQHPLSELESLGHIHTKYVGKK